MRGQGVATVPNHHAFGGPFHRQSIRDPREQLVAARVAPQDQVARSDLGVGDVLVLAYLRVAAKMASPFGNRAPLFADLTEASADPAAEAALDVARQAFGFTPNLAVVLALEPATLGAYLACLGALGETTLSPVEQQIVLMAARSTSRRSSSRSTSTLSPVAPPPAEAARRSGARPALRPWEGCWRLAS